MQFSAESKSSWLLLGTMIKNKPSVIASRHVGHIQIDFDYGDVKSYGSLKYVPGPASYKINVGGSQVTIFQAKSYGEALGSISPEFWTPS